MTSSPIKTALLILSFLLPASVGFAQTPTPSQIQDIISIYINPLEANQANLVCLSEIRQGKTIRDVGVDLVNNTIAAQARRDPNAISLPDYYRNIIAYCYDEIDRPAGSLSSVAATMGALQALKIKAGPSALRTNIDIEHAQSLLNFAAERGEDVDQFKAMIEPYLPKPEPTVDLGNLIEVDAAELSNERRNNRLRVKRKYEGETLRATGTVWSVRDLRDGSVMVRFDGWKEYLNGESGELANTEFLECRIPATDDASIDKAIELDKGDMFTATGVFGFSIINKMQLSDCRIE